MSAQKLAFAILAVLVSQLCTVLAYDASRSDNIVVYYGQNSIGVSNSNQAVWQKALSTYCQDDTINVFPLAFMNVFFSTGGLPEINLANTCSSNSGVFAGTSLANCQFMAADIKSCQSKGKLITLSVGGATGAAGFTSDAQAQQFATTIWNLFLGGSSSTRPFGDAVLDGIDLDIEGGSGAYFPTFINKLKSLANGASKRYWYTAAPQCPFPDAYLGSIINAVGFDAIYVQFYNNFCSLPNYNNPNAWNFADWFVKISSRYKVLTARPRDNWAKNTSPNKGVKIFIGAPASSTAATSGYVDASTLSNIAASTRSKYSSFGGVMFWDASQVFGNNRIDKTVKAALGGGGGGTTPPTTTPPTTTPPTTTPPTSGSCAGVPTWSSSVAYNGGSTVTYNSHLWTAKWWTQADTPGGAAGVWTDNGACKSKVAVPTPDVTTSATIIATTAISAPTTRSSASSDAPKPVSRSAPVASAGSKIKAVGQPAPTLNISTSAKPAKFARDH
ncbi:glycoside hydrolase superfamily [Crepidotus variabilis]|uniref:chitinase n=1 Tax=Crepidotus variabilis TaxID=179855 RepID=A0A9P6JJR9_9AGAR|nr:glycoside hydrolase superfamily [Crepidotus variabilis]